MFVVEVKNGVVYEFLYEDNLLIQEEGTCGLYHWLWLWMNYY